MTVGNRVSITERPLNIKMLFEFQSIQQKARAQVLPIQRLATNQCNGYRLAQLGNMAQY